MATLQQLADALKRADAAGDVDGAKKLAAAYRAMQTQAPAATAPDTPPPGADPGSREYADWAAVRARMGKGRELPQISDVNPGPHGFADQMAAGASSAANALPIVGPTALGGLEGLRGAVQHMTPEQVQAETKANELANPAAAMTGSIAGRVLPYVAAAEVPGLATVLGLDAAAPIGASMILGGASQKAIDYLDNKARGQDPSQKVIDAGPIQLTSGDIAGLGGTLGPLVGPAVGATVRGLGTAGEKIGDAFQSVFHPQGAADKTVGKAIAGDLAAGQHMTGEDLATARQTQQPMINADVFGDKTKGLLQKALPADPVAMDAVQASLAERAALGAKKDRAGQFFNDITGGNTNFQLAQEAVNTGRVGTNNAAYDAAKAAAPAAGIWTPRIAEMLAVPDSALRDAIAMTTRTGADEAVAKGTAATVRNPFRFNSNGTYALVKGAAPSLDFWDHVQRNLGTLGAAAKGYNASNIFAAQKALNAELDNVVPLFQTARQGAAKFFDANDALEAGQKFAMSNADPNVAAAAVTKFSPQEQKLFGVGGVSKIMNVLDQAGSPATVDRLLDPGGKAAKQLDVMLTGWPKYVRDQVPSFMRVQQALQDTSKFVKAASATKLARQLGQAGAQSGVGGIAGGLAGGVTGGSINPLDWDFGRVGKGAVMGAAAAAGVKLLGSAVNKNVLSRVANMLASNDPTEIKNAIAYATKNPQAHEALRVIAHGAHSLTQQAVVSAGLLASPTAAAQPQPEGTTP